LVPEKEDSPTLRLPEADVAEAVARGLLVSVSDPAVDYKDLAAEFWGEPAAAKAAEAAPDADQRVAATNSAPIPLRRRGRKPKYPWPELVAAAADHMQTASVAKLAELEGVMKQ
jgi:hypothetical protein